MRFIDKINTTVGQVVKDLEVVVLIGWTTGIIIDFFATPCNFVKYIS